MTKQRTPTRPGRAGASRSPGVARVLVPALGLALALAGCVDGRARLTGTVEGTDGTPLSGVRVALAAPATDSALAHAETADGRFELEAPDGLYRLRVSRRAGREGAADSTEAPLWLDRDTELRMALPRPPGRLSFGDPGSSAARLVDAHRRIRARTADVATAGAATRESAFAAEAASAGPATRRSGAGTLAGVGLLERIVDSATRRGELEAVSDAAGSEAESAAAGSSFALSAADAAAARATLTPAWPLWSFFEPELAYMYRAFERRVEESPDPYPLWDDPERLQDYFDYMERVAREHPDPGVRAAALFHAMQGAYRAGMDWKANGYLPTLLNGFPGTEWAARARTRPNPVSEIRPGSPVPEFTLRAPSDASTVHTPETLRGEVVLIDFWATWCAPCIAEMETLHETYARYSEQGFEILSVNVGEDAETIDRFRSDRWPMPWKHGSTEWGSPAVRALEVPGLPRTILLDRDGRILEARHGIMGDDLPRAVEEALATAGPDGG